MCLKNPFFRSSLIALALMAIICATLLTQSSWAKGKTDNSPYPTPFGEWVGYYFCPQGMTGLTLTIREDKESIEQNALWALFDFYPLPNNLTMSGQFIMEGTWNVRADEIILSPLDWVNRPSGWSMISLSLKPSKNFDFMEGSVANYGCGKVHLKRAI